MSARYTVVRRTWSKEVPAASRIPARFRNTRCVGTVMSPSTITPLAGSSGIWPETKSSEPARIACEYGPMAAGAADVETASRIDGLRRLDDLAGTEAARAHAQPLDTAVHERAHPLEVRLEPPGSHVMRVTDVPSDDGTFSADFATFCHGFRSGVERRDLSRTGPPRRREERSAQTSNYTPPAQVTKRTHTFVADPRPARQGRRIDLAEFH